jgi:8-oxo-dGTP pyrophosphatase MutT (NUDIX family)
MRQTPPDVSSILWREIPIVSIAAWIKGISLAPPGLSIHHRKLGIWLQLGGHSDGESDVLSVAMDEAVEESGLTSLEVVCEEIFDLDVHGIPARKNEPAHFHYDVRFLFRQTGAEDYIVSEESHDLAWVPMAELESYTSEWSMRRMRDKAVRILSSKE